MKKQITFLGILLLLITAAAFTAFTQKEKQNQKEQKQKEQKPNQGKKEDKANNGRNDNTQKDKMEKENQGNKNDKDKNDGNGNKGKNDNKDHSNGNHNENDGYQWDRETFKDRKKFKNAEKVTICHKFNRDDEPAVTLRVSSNAAKAHMNHGDVMGDCPAVTNNRYSDVFLRNRTDYYDNIQNSQEEVSYSKSILDYALSRLTASRLQLATMQNNNVPAAEIERKQATVVELEQNVSLLETLIGVAANLVANKLQ